MKAKKKDKSVPYELDMLQLAAEMVSETSFFALTPSQTSPQVQNLQIQRGIIRTNCIDSLDRTNQVQTLVGYHVALQQLNKLNLLKSTQANL
jgi:hypothetical protein